MHAQTDVSPRTSLVHKAVIPAAGLGTRLFPATKVAKKELLPIVDRDGIAKPAILLIVEEALNAGLEEIIIITKGNSNIRKAAIIPRTRLKKMTEDSIGRVT